MKYNPKTYYIKTYGCQANIADSSKMAGILEALGFEAVIPKKKYLNEKDEFLDLLPKSAIFIINTCSVRQKSEDKVYGLGKTLKAIKDLNKKVPFTILSGCMVGSVTGERQRYEFKELNEKTPWVDLYMNPSQINDLPQLLIENKIIDNKTAGSLSLSNIELRQNDSKHAYVNISYGCDNFCSYCVVPYARGKEISRSEKEIVDEINRLIIRGYTEFTLCGQNVNSWGLPTTEKFKIRAGSNKKLPFANLLRNIHKLENVTKIEFLSSNPFDFTKDLIEAISLPKISNYLHIAVQSGSNEILKKMNRRHKIEEFYKLISEIKKAKPAIEFGTDIIVGFPGETVAQFNETIKLFKKIKFNVAFISIYSPRKGTPAEKFYKDDVSREEKKRRHAELTKVWKQTKKRR